MRSEFKTVGADLPGADADRVSPKGHYHPGGASAVITHTHINYRGDFAACQLSNGGRLINISL